MGSRGGPGTVPPALAVQGSGGGLSVPPGLHSYMGVQSTQGTATSTTSGGGRGAGMPGARGSAAPPGLGYGGAPTPALVSMMNSSGGGGGAQQQAPMDVVSILSRGASGRTVAPTTATPAAGAAAPPPGLIHATSGSATAAASGAALDAAKRRKNAWDAPSRGDGEDGARGASAPYGVDVGVASSLALNGRGVAAGGTYTAADAAAFTAAAAATASSATAAVGTDAYGLLGLLSVIRMTDRDLNTLALGTDLMSLSLNLGSDEPLHTSFAHPWGDTPVTRDPAYSLPACYKVQQPALKTGHLSKFDVTTLFYIFYAMPRDVLQAYAAQELYTREWRLHKESKFWYKREGDVWTVWDVGSWEKRLFTGSAATLQAGFLSEEEARVRPAAASSAAAAAGTTAATAALGASAFSSTLGGGSS